jgi:hypothetical protein
MEPSKKLESRQINEEGELIGAVFCEYCGGLNRADTPECEHCQKHIADQGPDLRARLNRISRYASAAPQHSRAQSDDNLISDLLTGITYSLVPLPPMRMKGSPSRITIWLKENFHEFRLLLLDLGSRAIFRHIVRGIVLGIAILFYVFMIGRILRLF